MSSGRPIMVQVKTCREVPKARTVCASLPRVHAVDDTRKVW